MRAQQAQKKAGEHRGGLRGRERRERREVRVAVGTRRGRPCPDRHPRRGEGEGTTEWLELQLSAAGPTSARCSAARYQDGFTLSRGGERPLTLTPVEGVVAAAASYKGDEGDNPQDLRGDHKVVEIIIYY